MKVSENFYGNRHLGFTSNTGCATIYYIKPVMGGSFVQKNTDLKNPREAEKALKDLQLLTKADEGKSKNPAQIIAARNPYFSMTKFKID